MNTNNSISTVIKQLMEINANSLKTFERINEAVTTDKQSIPLEILNEEGSTTTVYIPSFGYMQRELERLDRNFKSLTGLGTGSTKVKLADGTYQRVFTSTLKTPSKDITTLNRPTNFEVKPNYFFEDFLSPLLTARFDVSGQIPTDTERVLVKRLIIDSNSEISKEWFDDNYNGVDGIDYAALMSDMASNQIQFYNDEEVRDLPYRNTQYFGAFDVTSIDTVQRNVVIDGQSTTRKVKLYTLNKTTYSDNEKDFKETEVLKVGDDVMVNSGNRSTKYKILNIDLSTNQVELDLVEGYEPIRIGAGVLAIYKANDTNIELEINLGFDERVIVFFKAIDPYSKILAENWSPGAAIYTNDLTLTQNNGTVVSLSEYYKENVADFGQFIKALKDDSIPPATLGKTPDAPIVSSDNFKVVQINTHLTQNDAANKVKKLNSDKINIQESIKKLDDTIAKKRSQVSTKKYKSNIERDKDKNELSSLSNERSSETRLYSSLVNEIRSIASDSNLTKIDPKFRVRGFWSIPQPKLVADTTPQNVVQFIVQYRYLSTSGKASQIAQIKFNDTVNGNNTGERTAVFSNWNEIKTGVRQRVRGADGKFYWTDSAVEDGQAVNFNQLDLPIQSGEVVEIRIKSVSEAGWPANPITSDWSEVVRVEFPEGELDTSNVGILVSENDKETAKVEIAEELESRGVYQHIDDSFVANEKYYAHTATNIASGFLSPEQKPVSLFDKLTDLQNKVLVLEETISGIKGELAVKVVNEDGTITQINRNTNNKIFAGYYVNEVAELSVKKGHIVTKTFKLILENTRATTLELVARIIGDRGLPTYGSSTTSASSSQYGFGTAYGSGIDNKVINDTYYTTEGKYDLVPIQYQSLSSIEAAQTYNDQAPYQSAQRRGQFMYSRYMDIANEGELYLSTAFDTSSVVGNITDFEHVLGYNSFESATPPTLLSETGDGTSSDYIWSGTFGNAVDTDSDQINDAYDVSVAWSNTSTSSVVNVVDVTTLGRTTYDSGIFLHKDHPDLENIYASYQSAASNTSQMDMATEIPIAIQNTVDSAAYTMPRTAVLTSEDSSGLGKRQLAYKYTNGEITLGDRPLKMSFDANDQYLLGGKSCGSFLYVAPVNSSSLLVDGDNKFGRTYIKTGENNAISIDIVFQYRMTDYAGNDENSDLGRIGGIISSNVANLTYAKRIGIDIFDADSEQFSFDLEVFAKYKAQGSNRASVQAAQLVSNVNAVNFSI